MPHKGSSSRTLDLFEYTITIPTPPSDPPPVTPKRPALASLSDAELAQQLGQLLKEAQRRLEMSKGSRPELEAAIQQAGLSFDQLVPKPAKQARHSRASKTSSPLQAGQRKAVRAAHLAGVAPIQVAKHFGLSLAAVRKVLAEAE